MRIKDDRGGRCKIINANNGERQSEGTGRFTDGTCKFKILKIKNFLIHSVSTFENLDSPLIRHGDRTTDFLSTFSIKKFFSSFCRSLMTLKFGES